MNFKKSFLSLLVFISLGCININGQSSKECNVDKAVQIAILDFQKTNIYKKGKVFNIDIKQIDSNIIYVSFLETEENKYLYSITKPIEENILPSRYIEKDNKLFIWWDDDKKINQEMFDVLKKYNMLKDDEGGWITMLDYAMDDKKKGVNYFICKNNLEVFKRIITNKGNIETPKLKCPCNDSKTHTHPRKED
jgi:hypothetical protein